MPGRGLQDIPLRVPDAWDPAWFTRFVREVLALADVRNAVPGTGIEISGNSSEPATLSASGSVTALLNAPFVTMSPVAALTAERVLTGQSGVVSITDGGTTVTVGIDAIPYDLLGELPPLSIIGNQLAIDAQPGAIGGINEHDVLSIQLAGSDLMVQFGPITHESVSDFEPAVLAIVLPLLPFNRGATFAAGNSPIALPVNDVPIVIPIDCTITQVTVLTTGGAGSCVVDIFKGLYSAFPPSSSICAAAKPTIISSIKYQDATLTGWTVAIDAGDVLQFHLESSSVFTSIVVLLELVPVP